MAVTALKYGRKYQRGLNWITATAMTGFHVGAVAAFFFVMQARMAIMLLVLAFMLVGNGKD